MLDRFENIPDMLELDHLTVSGDVTFGKNVSLKVLYIYLSCMHSVGVVLSSCVVVVVVVDVFVVVVTLLEEL